MMTRLSLYLTLVSLLGGLCSCTQKKQTQKVEIPLSDSLRVVSYMPTELDSLFKPLYRDSFILQELHDEFRNPVERMFPMEQRMAHKTWILEFTWHARRDTLLTVWYLREGDSLRMLDHFWYSEFAVF